MISRIATKINSFFRISGRRGVCLLLGVVLLYNTAAAPLAEANFWRDRRASIPAASIDQTFPVVTKKIADFGTVSAAAQTALSSRISAETLGRLPARIVSLPAACGEIQTVHFSGQNNPSPFIVLIQDAHRIYPAQKSIANILEHLQSDVPLVVGMEGAAGEFDLGPYRRHANAEDHAAVCDYLMQEGVISGAEYFGLTSAKAPLLRGVEDRDLYLSNVDSYRRGLAVRAEWEMELETIEARLGPLKDKVFDARLRELDAVFEGYDSGRLDLKGYVQALGVGKVSARDFPNLTRLQGVFSQEASLDFSAAENERKRFIEKLSPRLAESDIASLVDHSFAFKAGKIGSAVYYSYLKDVSREKGVSLAEFPRFDRYIAYVLSAEGIDRFGLFEELDALKENVLASAGSSLDRRELLRIGEDMRLARRLAARELHANEWEKYLARRAEIGRINARVSALSKRDGDVSPFAGTEMSGADMRFGALAAELESFYRNATDRNKVMLDNFLGSLDPEDESGAATAAIVTGGFHSSGIENLLRERKMSFATVMPKFEHAVGGGADYLDVFALNKLPLERLLLGDKLDLSPPQALAPPFPGFEFVQKRFALLSAVLRVLSSFIRHGRLTEEERRMIQGFPGFSRVDAKVRGDGVGVHAGITVMGDDGHSLKVEAHLEPVSSAGKEIAYRQDGKRFRLRVSWPSQWAVRAKARLWNSFFGERQSSTTASADSARAVSSASLRMTFHWVLGFGSVGLAISVLYAVPFLALPSQAALSTSALLLLLTRWLSDRERESAVISDRGFLFWFDAVAQKRLLEKSVMDAWLRDRWRRGGFNILWCWAGYAFLGMLLVEEVIHGFNSRWDVKDVDADEFRARAGLVFSLWIVSIGVLLWWPAVVLAAMGFGLWGVIAVRGSTDASEFEYNSAARENVRMGIAQLFVSGATSLKRSRIHAELANVPSLILDEVIMELLENETEVFQTNKAGDELIVSDRQAFAQWLEKQGSIDRLLAEGRLSLASDVFIGNEASEGKYEELSRLMRLLRTDRGLSSPRALAGVANRIGALLAVAYKSLGDPAGKGMPEDERILIVNAAAGSAPFSNTFRRQLPQSHMVFAWPLAGSEGAVHLDIRDENGAIAEGALPESIVLMDTQLRSGMTLVKTLDELLKYYDDRKSSVRHCAVVVPVMSREGLLSFQGAFKDRDIEFTFLTAEMVDIEALEKDGAQTRHSKYGDLSQRFASFLLRIQKGEEKAVTIGSDAWKIVRRMGATVYQVEGPDGRPATLTWTANVEKLDAIESVWRAAKSDRADGKLVPWVPELYESYDDNLVVVREFIPRNLQESIEVLRGLDDARKREILLHWVHDIGRMLAWYRSHKLPMPSLRPEDLQLREAGGQIQDSHIVSVSIAGSDEEAKQETVQELQAFLVDSLKIFTPDFIRADRELALLQTWLDTLNRNIRPQGYVDLFISLTQDTAREKNSLQFRSVSPFMKGWLQRQSAAGRRTIEFFYQQFADQEMAVRIANRNAADKSDVAVGWDLDLAQKEGKANNLDDVIQLVLALGALKQEGSQAKSIRLAIAEKGLRAADEEFRSYLPYLFTLLQSMVGPDGLVILKENGEEVTADDWLTGLSASARMTLPDPYSAFAKAKTSEPISGVLSLDGTVASAENQSTLARELAAELSVENYPLVPLNGWKLPRPDLFAGFKGKHVVLVYGHEGNSNEGVVELILTLAALRAAGVHVSLVAPYLRYVRQDGITKEAYDIGTGISAETHLRLLSLLTEDMYFVNLHLSKTLEPNPSYKSSYLPEGLDPVRYHNVNALPLLLRRITNLLSRSGLGPEKIVAASPDEGFSNYVMAATDPVDGDEGFLSIVFEKTRPADAPAPRVVGVLTRHKKGPDKDKLLESPKGERPVNDVKFLAGKIVFLMDDISSTGGTQIEVANYILRQGRLGEEWGPWIWQIIKVVERRLIRYSGGRFRLPYFVFVWMGLPYDFQAVVVHGIFAKGLKETFKGSPIDHRNVFITDSLPKPADMEPEHVVPLAKLIAKQLRGSGDGEGPSGSPQTPLPADGGGSPRGESGSGLLAGAIPKPEPLRFLSPAQILRSGILTARGNYSEWAAGRVIDGNMSRAVLIGKILNPRVKWSELRGLLSGLRDSFATAGVSSLFTGETPLVVNLSGVSADAAQSSLRVLKLLGRRRSPVFIVVRGDSAASVLRAGLGASPNIRVLGFVQEKAVSWEDVSFHSDYQASSKRHSKSVPRFVRHPDAEELSGLPEGTREEVLYELFSKTLDLLRRVDELISRSA